MNTEPTSDDSPAGPLTAATDRLIATATTLDDPDLGQPSLCPGWTRAHVLTHVARNADGLTNLLIWARTGREHPMYPSREARNADIEAGAGRAVTDVVEDIRTSADRFTKAVMEMPDDGWERQVRTGPGGSGDAVPGRRLLWLRLRELELHHADLDAGYAPADWPAAFVRRALEETVRSFGRREDVPPITLDVDGATEQIGTAAAVTVAGAAPAILGWLTGRTDGGDLRVDPVGGLPELPAWL